MLKSLLFIFLVVFSNSIFSQIEYLVTINPNNGIHTKINSIPGVRYVNSGRSAFDENNGTFIFVGADANYTHSLYSIDVSTGSVIARVPFPIGLTRNDNLSSLIFNNSDSTLYAILYISSSQLNYLVTLNPTTGIHSIIDSIPGLQSILSESQVLDEANQTFSFVGLNQISFTTSLFTVDLLTASTLSSPNFPNLSNSLDAIFNLKQDSVNNLLGIYNSFNSNTYKLVRIDKTTGNHSLIDTLNGFSNYVPFNAIYNKSTNVYSFKAKDHNSNTRFYSYDANTANLISNPIFPVLADTNDNVTELQIDNSTGIVYGLHWDNDITTGLAEKKVDKQFQIYPNPASTKLNISIDNESAYLVEIFSNQGQLVFSKLKSANSISEINTEEFKSGLYYIRISTSQSTETKKVIFN